MAIDYADIKIVISVHEVQCEKHKNCGVPTVKCRLIDVFIVKNLISLFVGLENKPFLLFWSEIHHDCRKAHNTMQHVSYRVV